MAQATAAESQRTWTDASGKHTVETVLLGVENGEVQLSRPDGKILTVPIEKFSLADQQYINLPADPAIWPNRQSYRNSDPWLVANLDQIRVMKPRLLVLNF